MAFLPAEQHPLATTLELPSAPHLWTGLEANPLDGHHWGVAIAELDAAPALAGDETTLGVAAGHRRLASHIVRSLRSWTNAGALELRYVWDGAGGLRVVLIARAGGLTLEIARASAARMLDNVVGLLPHGYEIGPLRADLAPIAEAWTEIERAEEVRRPGPFVEPQIAGYYYLLHPMGGSGAGWPLLAPALRDARDPGFVSILLMPTALTDFERAAIDQICSLATYLSESQQDADFFGNSIVVPADAGARELLSSWGRFHERSGVLARIGVASSRREIGRLAPLVGSLVVEGCERSAGSGGAGAFKMVDDLAEYDAYSASAFGCIVGRYRHPVWSRGDTAPWSLARLPYFFGDEEAGGLLVLPVPDAQGVPGLARSRQSAARRSNLAVASDGPALRLGVVLEHDQARGFVDLPLAAVNLHALVVGSPGSGKTTTVLTLLAGLWRDHRVPFLVIEPAKHEYRSLLDAPGMEDLRVVCIGRDDVAPFRLNPLEPPAGVRRENHVSSVLAALKAALPLPAPLPQLLEQALDRAYSLAGWDDDATLEAGLRPPTLRGLLAAFDEVFDAAGYVGEARNIAAAVRVRIASLLTGSRGRVFDTVESVDIIELLDHPVVVELDDVADPDDKAVMAAFLLDRVRAAAKARGSSGNRLVHVTVLEEAHRLLAHAASGGEEAAARAHAVEAFCNAIAEMRASGEGFVVCSQSPGRLAAAAVSNCGTRIVHRMDSADDRMRMLADLDASDADREAAGRLLRGEAIARWPQITEPELIRVVAATGIDSAAIVSDVSVRDRMAAASAVVRSLLPYQLCTRDVCTSGCDPVTRSGGRQVAAVVGPAARTAWQDASGRPEATPPIASLLVDESARDVRLAYCGAVHLAVGGDAFTARSRSDVRPLLRDAITKAANGR